MANVDQLERCIMPPQQKLELLVKLAGLLKYVHESLRNVQNTMLGPPVRHRLERILSEVTNIAKFVFCERNASQVDTLLPAHVQADLSRKFSYTWPDDATMMEPLSWQEVDLSFRWHLACQYSQDLVTALDSFRKILEYPITRATCVRHGYALIRLYRYIHAGYRCLLYHLILATYEDPWIPNQDPFLQHSAVPAV